LDLFQLRGIDLQLALRGELFEPVEIHCIGPGERQAAPLPEGARSIPGTLAPDKQTTGQPAQTLPEGIPADLGTLKVHPPEAHPEKEPRQLRERLSLIQRPAPTPRPTPA
jgi:hypothetical protein